MAHIGEFVLEMGIVLILSLAISHQRQPTVYSRLQKVIVLLQEICFLPTSVSPDDIEKRFVNEFPSVFEIVFLNKPDTCNDSFLILPMLVKEIEDQRTVAVVGTTEPFLCDIISKLVEVYGKLFIAWNCPENAVQRTEPKSYTVQMLPAIRDVVGAVFSLFKHFRWKRAAIVSVENGAWWTEMGSEFEYVLGNENVSLLNNAFIILPTTSTELFIKRQLQQLMTVFKPKSTAKTNLDGALILCVPEYSSVFWKILRVLGDLQISIPVLVMRLSSSLFFYQYSFQRNYTVENRLYHNFMTNYDNKDENFSDNYNSTFKRYNKTDILNALVNNATSREDSQYNQTDSETDESSKNISHFEEFKLNVMMSPFLRYHSAQNFTNTLESLKHLLLLLSPHYTYHLSEESFSRLIKATNNLIESRTTQNFTDRQDKFSNDCFLLSDLTDASSRHILYLHKSESCDNCTVNGTNFRVTPLISDSSDWFSQKMMMKYYMNQDRATRCNEIACDESYDSFLDDLSLDAVLLIIFILIVVVVFTSCITMVARKQYVTRRRMKDPCKILLTSEDIIFPQITEPRRVEEGIEAMLCCWLQQLHEFGGPEVDKPDLLKGPDDSVKSFPLKHVNSSNSVTKPIASNEIRARYNGDLVQLKDIPVHGSAFELRSKSLNVLMNIHGLRHENLNPLIGLLVDPVRPALVWEYCSRGSLEDVLIQDEIKLDWSFRLSLLTDLVRGMKYLHSNPYRIHGTLSSRNCVIDARWVLKITDYCLTEFNDAQNITTINKTARDLLWIAPELLRNESLLRRGTRQGDVYSFAIIMQEVVVRGEPFCMLSLSPEDIIEKLKKPPPLIRPSVSKGAAPPEAINIMRQCWAEQAEKRPDFNAIYDLFKTLNHGRKINFVDTMFQMLEKYSNNLEDLIRERTEQLDMEKKKTEQLLNRMLPNSVADKLKLGMPVDPEEFSEVTIYFSDIVGFTTISAYSTPFEVVDLLNDLYTSFDATINAYNVYKVETIGDAYMVVGGLPVRIPDHADQIATMALDLLHQSGQFKIRHLPLTPLRLRIGLHTGPCCAGVVGLTMPRYCLFGDTVNTASRLESTGSPGRIHISEATKLKLDLVGKYRLEYRGETELKGKGKMPTYWLLGKEAFDKEIPTPPPVTENHGLDEELIKTSREYRYQKLGACGKLPSESSIDIEHPISNSKQLVVQKSLDSGLFTDSGSSYGHKSWNTRRQMTFDSSDRNEYYRHAISFEQKMKHIPEASGKLLNSGTNSPFSTSDKNIDLVGVPFVNKNVGCSTSTGKRKNPHENDLSTPYNYYRCLPPNENPTSTKFVSKFLKRQFSVDKSDESAIVLQEVPITKTSKLFKQNSAGHDGDKTEKTQVYRFNNNILPSLSISAESLT